MIKMLLIIALLAAVIPTQQDIVYPEDNPDCATPWSLLFHFEKSIHCDGGEYYLFVCQPLNIRKPMIYSAFCLSSTRDNLDENVIYLPIVKR